MKKFLSLLICFAGSFLATGSYSQWQPSWNLGVNLGVVKGVNEAINQSFDPQFNLYGLWLNGLAPHLSVEAGIGSAKISSPHQGGYSEYSTSLIPIDLRIRYTPFEDAIWQPYLYAGLGLLSYSVTSAPPNKSPDAALSGTAAFLPLGIGLYHPIGNNFAVDCSVGASPSFTDDLNPVRDSRNDAYWGLRIGISYSFGSSESQPNEYELGARGTTQILANVTFDSASSLVKKESESQLSQILSLLGNHPEIEVEFRSYTDDSGDFNANMALTHDRAESLKVWLVSRGVSTTQISTQGYGPHNPLVPNDTPENRKKNCRIEIVRMK